MQRVGAGFNIFVASLLRNVKSLRPMPARRGMLIKNVAERPLSIRLSSRTLSMVAGEELLITAEEVRDPVLRENLQVRTIAIVRPATEEEDAAFAAKAE